MTTVWLDDFGTGSDATDAILRARDSSPGGMMLLGNKTYCIGSSLVGELPQGTHLCGTGRNSRLLKQFSGDYMVEALDSNWFSNLTLDANGEGGIIDIPAGHGNQMGQNLWLENAYGLPCVHVTAANGLAGGSQSHWRNVVTSRLDAQAGQAGYCIEHDDDGLTEGHPMFFEDLKTGGYNSLKSGSCNNMTLIGCTLFDMLLSDNTRDLQIHGGRLAGHADLDLRGTGVLVDGDVYPDIYLKPGTGWSVRPALHQGSIYDESLPANKNTIWSTKMMPWPAEVRFGGNPITLGTGGSISARHQLNGKEISCKLRVLFGTGPTIPQGPLTITLPRPGEANTPDQRAASGTLQDSTNTYHSITGKIGAGGAEIAIERAGQAISAANLAVTHANPGASGSSTGFWISWTQTI